MARSSVTEHGMVGRGHDLGQGGTLQPRQFQKSS